MVYFFNFETGESIWDHPYDEFYKNLVREERKIIADVGLANYKPPPSDDPRLVPYKLKSPLNTLKPSSGISTTTLSGEMQQQQQEMRRSLLRNEIDSGRELTNVEYEEDQQQQQQQQQDEQDNVEYEDDYESDESAKSKSDEDDDDSSDGFKKPVDFGIEKELSIKLDRLNLPVTIGRDAKEPATTQRNANNNDPDSVTTTSREQLDSPKRPYHRGLAALKDEDESSNRKSLELRSSVDSTKLQLETIDEEKQSRLDAAQQEYQKSLAQFSQKLQRKYDEECLELMENKDMKLKKIKQEIEESLNQMREQENKRLTAEHNQKLK